MKATGRGGEIELVGDAVLIRRAGTERVIRVESIRTLDFTPASSFTPGSLWIGGAEDGLRLVDRSSVSFSLAEQAAFAAVRSELSERALGYRPSNPEVETPPDTVAMLFLKIVAALLVIAFWVWLFTR